mmetsp:Transcript_16387/g.35458  ORF Transcript_16387/g.35458 Transcript_16387/m.35458 type:complete len:393 (-) Transcript_16387:86-1264(-)
MSSTPPMPPLPPPSPLPLAQNDANNQGIALHPPAAANSVGVRRTDVTSTADAFFVPLLPTLNIFDDVPVVNCGTDDANNGANTFTNAPTSTGARSCDLGMVEVDDSGVINPSANSQFPSKQPPQNTQFCNHNKSLFEKGYDSEGEQMHYNQDSLEEDAEEFDKNTIRSGPPPPHIASAAAATTAPQSPELKEEDVTSMKNMTIMKTELKKRGLHVNGARVQLEEWLKKAIRDKLPVKEVGEVAARDASLHGLDVTAFWELLMPNSTPVPEPINEDLMMRPPTDRDAPVNKKYQYDELFCRTPFLGTTIMMQYITDKSTRKRKKGKGFTPARNARNTKQLHEVKSRVKGGPNMEFLNKYGLDEHSHPMDWFNAILPMTLNNNLEDPVHVFIVH